jgi:hypothetical protein
LRRVDLGVVVREVPEHIGECNQEQYLYFVQLVIMLEKGHLSFEEVQLLWVYKLLDLSYTGKLSESGKENLAQLIDLTDSFFEIEKGAYRANTEWAANLVPDFKWKLRKFKGPADALADVTIKQFLRGLELSTAYAERKDPKYLLKLLSHFYLRVSPMCRAKTYSELEAQKSEKLLARLPEHYLYGFYFFFQSAVKYLTSQEIEMADGRRYNFSPLFGSGESDGQSIGPMAVLFSLAENKVFGSINETENRNLIECLIYLLDRHYEKERLLKRSDSDRSE